MAFGDQASSIYWVPARTVCALDYLTFTPHSDLTQEVLLDTFYTVETEAHRGQVEWFVTQQ